MKKSYIDGLLARVRIKKHFLLESPYLFYSNRHWVEYRLKFFKKNDALSANILHINSIAFYFITDELLNTVTLSAENIGKNY